jgi:AraC family L-rhamnose operon regulatory protein RhaS
MEEQMDLYTRSYDNDWNRIVYLKVLEGRDAISGMKDPQTCKLILVLEGNGMIECNNRLLYINAPALMCINQEEFVALEENQNLKIKVLFFNPVALNDKFSYHIFNEKYYDKMEGTTFFQDLIMLHSFYDIRNSKRTLILLEAASSVILKKLMDNIKEELESQKDGYWPCRSRSYFIELLFFLEGLRCEEPLEERSVAIQTDASKLIHNIVSYLNQNINQKMTLELLEKKLGCNRNKINSEFQKEMNTTVMKYFVWMRMQLAGAILRDTEIPIIEVALRVGYSDASYFSRTFKDHYGKTPREYQSILS